MKSKVQQKIIIVLMAVIAVFGTGLSCFGGSGNKDQAAQAVTLTFWKPFDSSDQWRDIITAYQKFRPNVKVQYSQKAAESYERDLLNAMASGNGPDIFSIRNDWVPQYREKIAPMPEGLIDARTFSDTFVDVVAQDMILEDGRVYGLTPTVDVLALYYNKDHFASAGIGRAPTTWQELLNQVPRLSQYGANGVINRGAVALGTSANINKSADILSLLLLQNGAEFYDPSFNTTSLTRNAAASERAVRFYTQFADPSSQAYSWNNQMDHSIDAFTQGKVSAMLGYSYLMPALSAKQGFLNYGVAGAPQINSTGSKVNFASYWVDTAWTGSANSAWAWDFIVFANRYEHNKTYTIATQLPSSRRDVLAEQQQDPVMGPFADNVLTAQSIKKPEVVQFDKILTDLVDSVTISGMTPVNAINQADQQLRTLLTRHPIRPRSN